MSCIPDISVLDLVIICSTSRVPNHCIVPIMLIVAIVNRRDDLDLTTFFSLFVCILFVFAVVFVITLIGS